MAQDLTASVLDVLAESHGGIETSKSFPTIPFTEIKSALDRLSSREMVTYETTQRDEYVLSEEAQEIVKNGSHEAKVFEALLKATEGLTIPNLQVCGAKRMPEAG